MTRFEQRVKKVISDHLAIDVGEIENDASLSDDLGADSLDSVEIVMGLEEEFECAISGQEAEEITTVQDAIDKIEADPNAR